MRMCELLHRKGSRYKLNVSGTNSSTLIANLLSLKSVNKKLDLAGEQLSFLFYQ